MLSKNNSIKSHKTKRISLGKTLLRTMMVAINKRLLTKKSQACFKNLKNTKDSIEILLTSSKTAKVKPYIFRRVSINKNKRSQVALKIGMLPPLKTQTPWKRPFIHSNLGRQPNQAEDTCMIHLQSQATRSQEPKLDAMKQATKKEALTKMHWLSLGQRSMFRMFTEQSASELLLTFIFNYHHVLLLFRETRQRQKGCLLRKEVWSR